MTMLSLGQRTRGLYWRNTVTKQDYTNTHSITVSVRVYQTISGYVERRLYYKSVEKRATPVHIERVDVWIMAMEGYRQNSGQECNTLYIREHSQQEVML